MNRKEDSNIHFKAVADWERALSMIDFQPRRPTYTAGHQLKSLAVHVKDHKKNLLPVSQRSLEAHYGEFTIDQKRAASPEQARRDALSKSYGASVTTVYIAGHEGRSYPLGPESETDSIDGRSPAVIVWAEHDRFFLVASEQLTEQVLHRVALSMYDHEKVDKAKYNRSI